MTTIFGETREREAAGQAASLFSILLRFSVRNTGPVKRKG
jgi:hypothetical protein